MMKPQAHPCAFCGEPNAGYGYRKRGLWSEQAKKGYLWACKACRPKAEERKGKE